MSIGSHTTRIMIVPKLYNKCQKLVGKRVTIYYINGVRITGFLRRIINEKQILINCELDGLYRLPILFIERIEEH